MQIFYEKNLSNLNINSSSIALGSFESLHIGHMDIIRKTVECAKNNNTKSIVTIFKEPILKLRNTVCETLENRLEILENAKVDYVIIFEFTESFKQLSADEFFRNILVKKLKASHIFVGFNYHFGNKAKGDTTLLEDLCKKTGIKLNVAPPVKTDRIISSTYIYELIESGNIKTLNLCLGRPYSISGIVSKGRQIGNTIGFPTANIDYPTNKKVIKEGVYSGKCHIREKEYASIINVGSQPTVTKNNTPKIEAHLLDFNGNLYGNEIRLDFHDKIRDIIAFDNIEDLKEQLKKDKEFCK